MFLEHVIKFAEENKVVFDVYIDVDPNHHRTGINPHDDTGLHIAKRIIDSPHVNLIGVYAHGGHSYLSANADQIRKIAEEERDFVVGFAEKVEKAYGVKVPVRAIGSTPTANIPPDSLKGVTEMHPGNYPLNDTWQATIKSCEWVDVSNTLLARVLSKYNFPKNRLLIDAGALALSKDRGPIHVAGFTGYGAIKGHPELTIVGISQEVGIVEALPGSTLDLDKFPIGTLIEIYPNHSCLSNYNFDKIYITDGEYVIDEWNFCPRH